jgi:hypothetical protein
MEQPRSPKSIAAVDLGELAHRLRNHIFTISLGLKSMDMLRDDPDRLARLIERVRGDAMEGLEEIALTLDGLAERASSRDAD